MNATLTPAAPEQLVQAPADYPEFAQFLVEQKIDSISLNPDSVLSTTKAILETEKKLCNDGK